MVDLAEAEVNEEVSIASRRGSEEEVARGAGLEDESHLAKAVHAEDGAVDDGPRAEEDDRVRERPLGLVAVIRQEDPL